MPLIANDLSYALRDKEAADRAYRRLSLPQGGEDRWPDEGPDLSFLFGDIPAQTLFKPATTTSLSLPKLSLGLPRSSEWGTEYAPQPEYVESNASEMSKQVAQTAKGYSGGSGISAYGYKGITGLPNLKGPAQFGFQTPMWEALGRANAAMKAAGLGTFGITDGWRSYEQQVALEKKKPGLAATPGQSIHGLGLAADLKATGAQKEWLRKNAQSFGLYFPFYDKEDWHIQLLPNLWTGGWQ